MPTTPLTKNDISAIFHLAIGSTEGATTAYHFDDAWADFQRSVLGRASNSAALKGLKLTTWSDFVDVTKQTEVVDGKTVPTDAAKAAQAIVFTVRGPLGQNDSGMLNSSQTVGLMQYDFGAQAKSQASAWGITARRPLGGRKQVRRLPPPGARGRKEGAAVHAKRARLDVQGPKEVLATLPTNLSAGGEWASSKPEA